MCNVVLRTSRQKFRSGRQLCTAKAKRRFCHSVPYWTRDEIRGQLHASRQVGQKRLENMPTNCVQGAVSPAHPDGVQLQRPRSPSPWFSDPLSGPPVYRPHRTASSETYAPSATKPPPVPHSRTRRLRQPSAAHRTVAVQPYQPDTDDTTEEIVTRHGSFAGLRRWSNSTSKSSLRFAKSFRCPPERLRTQRPIPPPPPPSPKMTEALLRCQNDRYVHMWDYQLEQWQELPFSEVVQRFHAAVDIRDRKFRLVTYRRCFVGSAAIQALVNGAVACSREDALRIGQILLEAGVIEHCLREHEFEDANLFYRFIEDTDRGAIARRGNRFLSWADYLTNYTATDALVRTFYPPVDISRLPLNVTHVAKAFWPMDLHNVSLLDNVHPPQWIDPQYSGTYTLVVIGAGAGGIEAVTNATQCGAKVALIEANVLGGASLNVGCVPSKALLKAANLAHTMRNSMQLAHVGIEIQGKVKIDFEKVMARIRKVRAKVSRRQSALRFTRKLGVDVFYGHAKFTSEKTLVVSGNLIEFKRAIIATGAFPSVPPIPGLRELYGKQDTAKEEGAPQRPRSVMTNDNFFNMTTQPRRLCVLGTGVIAMELAQAMQRLGSQVTMFGRADGVLPNEDRDLVADVVRQMEDDGVRFRLHVSEYRDVRLSGEVSSEGYEEVLMRTVERNTTHMYRFDAILVATGRKPNVTGLSLESAFVDYDTKLGIKVNDLGQTTNTRIYSVGDCCTGLKMTHAAQALARVVVRNALFLGRDRTSDLLVPYVAHTTPALARVGPTSGELRDEGRVFDTLEYPFSMSDRAVCDDATTGMIRVHIETATGALLGATILGNGAAVIVSELEIAMKADVRVAELSMVVHPYPTTSSVVRDVALLGAARRAPVAQRRFRSARRQSVNNAN